MVIGCVAGPRFDESAIDAGPVQPHLERQLERRSDLARHAEDRHAVWTIAGHLEVDDRVFRADTLDALDGEATQRHDTCDLVRVLAHIDELAQPGEENLHAGNCSRKRRSFS
jgi:hypothetical protein